MALLISNISAYSVNILDGSQDVMYFRTAKTGKADNYKLSICLKNSSFAIKSLQCTVVLQDGASFVQDGDGYQIEKSTILDDNWTIIAKHKNGDQDNSVTVLLYNTNNGSQIGTGNREVASMPLILRSNDATNKVGAFIKDVTLTGSDLKEYSGESYSLNFYTLTYYVDGIVYKTEELKAGASITPEEELTKTGYTFSGWSAIPSKMPANDVEINGHFGVRTYNLVYKVDGEPYDTCFVDYGDSIKAIANPGKTGYTFSGWKGLPDVMPANDVVINGSFDVNSYNIVYMVDSVVYRRYSLQYGSTITPEPNPVNTGYSFSGWSEIPSTMPADDLVITGSFSINEYNLVYKIDGDTCKSLKVKYGAVIVAEKDSVKEGYTFSGWSEIPETMPANDVLVTATFSVNSYNLIYKVDGVTYKSLKVEYGSDIVLETAPVKDGCTFSGWSDAPSSMPANDVVINGSFNANSYNLVYKLDGEVYKSYVVEYGTAITPETAPTKDGYTFSGWSGLPNIMPANDVTIIGSFGMNTYNLIYKIDDIEYRRFAFEFGAELTAEPAPTRVGYTFSGWSDVPATMPSSDVVITGTFTINSYNLVYTLDGDTCKTVKVFYGSSIIAETDPVKEGYTFSGWSDIPEIMPANDVLVTGTFSINSYNLVYRVDSIAYKSFVLNYGSAITAQAEPVKEGYTFSGWSEIPSTMPADDVVVTGSFIVNSYNLVYVVDGDTCKSLKAEYGSTITAIADPIKEGCTFLGWSGLPDVMPANDVTVIGSFGLNSYTLVYKVDSVEYRRFTVKYGSTVTVEPDPSKVGYTFSGWSDIPSTMPAKDVVVTGTFNVNTYNLIYLVDGDTCKSVQVVYASAISAEPNPVKIGYTFSGWSDIPAIMPANDVVVTGTFSINSYNLVYKLDGEIYNTSIVEYGSTIIAESDPTKVGYTFSGWSAIPDIMPANDVEITGTFRINSYRLVYILDGDTCKSLTVEYGSTITAEAAPVKEGHTFSGWSDIPATMPAFDVVVTGSFSINSYNLIYKVDGGVYRSSALQFGSTITAIADPVKVGYTFSGWSEIPATMPANDVIIEGSFVINKYLLTVIVDDKVVFSDSIAYGTRLADYIDLLIEKGIDFSQWEWYGDIATITMPAYDVTINANLITSVQRVIMDADTDVIYDLTGKRIIVDDSTILPPGVYIRNGRKMIVR